MFNKKESLVNMYWIIGSLCVSALLLAVVLIAVPHIVSDAFIGIQDAMNNTVNQIGSMFDLPHVLDGSNQTFNQNFG